MDKLSIFNSVTESREYQFSLLAWQKIFQGICFHVQWVQLVLLQASIWTKISVHEQACKQKTPRETVNKRKLRKWAPRGGGTLNKFLYGEALPGGPTPYPFIYHFWQKKVPLLYTFHWLKNGTPFTCPLHPFSKPLEGSLLVIFM